MLVSIIIEEKYEKIGNTVLRYWRYPGEKYWKIEHYK